jgi:hypothetical protein
MQPGSAPAECLQSACDVPNVSIITYLPHPILLIQMSVKISLLYFPYKNVN